MRKDVWAFSYLLPEHPIGSSKPDNSQACKGHPLSPLSREEGSPGRHPRTGKPSVIQDVIWYAWSRMPWELPVYSGFIFHMRQNTCTRWVSQLLITATNTKMMYEEKRFVCALTVCKFPPVTGWCSVVRQHVTGVCDTAKLLTSSLGSRRKGREETSISKVLLGNTANDLKTSH